MRTIGLIGGMSWESTLVYYRLLNEGVRARRGALHSADVLMRSLDFEAVVRLQKAGRWDEAGAMLGAAGAGLARAGAECLLICTNTMHLVSGAVERAAPVPLIDIVAETGRAAAGIDALVPEAEDRALVHDIIFDELCQGIVRDASRARLIDAVRRGAARGADGVILGCTEICLLLDPARLPLPGFDSTAIHAAAALDFALDAGRARGAETPSLRRAA